MGGATSLNLNKRFFSQLKNPNWFLQDFFFFLECLESTSSLVGIRLSIFGSSWFLVGGDLDGGGGHGVVP